MLARDVLAEVSGADGETVLGSQREELGVDDVDLPQVPPRRILLDLEQMLNGFTGVSVTPDTDTLDDLDDVHRPLAEPVL